MDWLRRMWDDAWEHQPGMFALVIVAVLATVLPMLLARLIIKVWPTPDELNGVREYHFYLFPRLDEAKRRRLFRARGRTS